MTEASDPRLVGLGLGVLVLCIILCLCLGLLPCARFVLLLLLLFLGCFSFLAFGILFAFVVVLSLGALLLGFCFVCSCCGGGVSILFGRSFCLVAVIFAAVLLGTAISVERLDGIL